jgi:hypothetical protein
LPPFWFSNRHINERDVIIWDVLIAIISRNILRKFLGWHSLIRHACQFKLQNVPRIIYQDLSGNKFATGFLAISRISAGVLPRPSKSERFYFIVWFLLEIIGVLKCHSLTLALKKWLKLFFFFKWHDISLRFRPLGLFQSKKKIGRWLLWRRNYIAVRLASSCCTNANEQILI